MDRQARGVDAARAFEECGARTQGLATAAQLAAAGFAAPRLSRAVASGTVLRLRRQVYALVPLPPLPAHVLTSQGLAPEWVLRVRVALLSLGPRASAGGTTAALLHGWALLQEPRSVLDVVVDHGRSRARVAGVRVTQRRSTARSRVLVLPGTERLSVTSPVDTALECCVSLPEREAVVLVDSALRSGRVTLEELGRAARSVPGRRGAERVRRVLSRCDPLSGSVLESVQRCAFQDAGLTGWTTQQVVRDRDGRHVLRADFCFPAARVVVEVDGRVWHRDAARDQDVDNRLAAAGWRVLRFTWSQVLHRQDEVLALVREALDARPDVHPALTVAA